MCESVASDDWVVDNEAITCRSRTYSAVWCPNVAEMMAMHKVPDVACVCWGVRAGAFFISYVGASNDALDRPGGGFSN